MKKRKVFTGLIATNKPDLNGLIIFSKEVLENMPNKLENLPVTFNFDPNQVIGHVLSSKITPDGVDVEFALNEKAPIDDLLKMMYIVPGGIVAKSHQDKDIFVIDEFKPTETSIVMIPANTSIGVIKKSKKKKGEK